MHLARPRHLAPSPLDPRSPLDPHLFSRLHLNIKAGVGQVIRIVLLVSGSSWTVMSSTQPLIFQNVMRIYLAQTDVMSGPNALTKQFIAVHRVMCPNKDGGTLDCGHSCCPLDDTFAQWGVDMVSAVSMRLMDSHFYDNSAIIAGGAVSLQSLLPEAGPLLLTNLTMQNNKASLTGGALAVNSFAAVSVADSRLEANNVFLTSRLLALHAGLPHPPPLSPPIILLATARPSSFASWH